MAKAVGTPQNSYCFLAKVRASLLDSTGRPVQCVKPLRDDTSMAPYGCAAV